MPRELVYFISPSALLLAESQELNRGSDKDQGLNETIILQASGYYIGQG
jgi:hypothetical protein